LEEFKETLVEFDNTNAELVFEFKEDTQGIAYNAYCVQHKRSITGWTTSNAQIINAIYYHTRRNPGHTIKVYQRVI